MCSNVKSVAVSASGNYVYELQQIGKQYPPAHSREQPEVQHGRDSVDE